MRWAIFLAVGAVMLAACGGGGGAGDEDAVRRDVERAGEIIFGDEIGLIQFQEYIAHECREDDDLGALLARSRLPGNDNW